MINQMGKTLYGGWMLLRFIAVISSSIVTIISSLLPLFLYSSVSSGYLLLMFIFLSLTALTIHGLLTHLLNDYTDYLSGTDHKSPAILSGGSRVIQKGMAQPQVLWQLGKWLTITLIIVAIVLMIVGKYKLTVLLLAGIWSATSYSLPPLKLSYRPFVGEWFSLFPAIFLLGIAGPWIILDTIPLWAMQNAIINALICMAWVMIHHIPDIDADRQAVPKKCTSVVWFVDRYDIRFAKIPAFAYLLITGLCAIWLGSDRILAACFLVSIISYGLFLIFKMDLKDVHHVTHTEKTLLLLAIITALMIGIL